MRRYSRIVICGILILLSIIANVYSGLWVLWKAPVSVRIDPLDPRSSDLSVSCDPSTISMGSITLIGGRLCNATSGVGISDQEIDLYHSQSGNYSWMWITTVTTISDGTYSYMWTEAAALNSGFYVINATFAGNIEFDGWTSLTDLQVVSGLPPGDLSLRSIEPIQVISNSKALVANKSTAMRVDIFSAFSGNKTVTINVTYDFGTKTYTEKGREGDGVPIEPGWNRIYIPGGPIYAKQGGTWRVNEPYWTPPEGNNFFFKWTNTGVDDSIKIILDPENLIIEADESNNEQTTSANVVESYKLRILVVPVYFPAIGQNPFIPFMEKNKDFLQGTYPLGDDSVEWKTTTPKAHPGIPPTEVPIYLKIWLYMYVAVPISAYARLLGYDRAVIVISDLGQSWSGMAPGVFWNDRVPVFVVQEHLFDYDLVAHEIGHTYYIWHPHDFGPPVYDAELSWVAKREYETFAWTFMSYEDKPWWIDEGRYDSDQKEWLVIPWVPPAWRWNLFDQLTKESSSTISSATQGGQDALLIRGVLFKNGTVSAEDSWYRLTTEKTDLEPGKVGNYSILLLDSEKSIINEFYFNATFLQYSEQGEPIETDYMPFIFIIPHSPGTTSIEIRNATGSVLASRNVTSNPPTVSITSPNGGEILTAGLNYTITWIGSDVDGDNLTYTVAYSEDGGESWSPLTIDLNQTNYIWDTSYLQKGSNYLVKVIATDGINTDEDVSDNIFTVKVHNVATTHVIPYRTMVGQGYDLKINVTIANEGDFTETFNVTAYANTTSIGIREITLGAGGNTTITFGWNTTGITYGDYTISASAVPVELEFYRDDNTHIDGEVLVTIAGDVDGDLDVDYDDFIVLAGAYGSSSGQPAYKPEADFDNDGYVDYDDFIVLAGNYGKTI